MWPVSFAAPRVLTKEQQTIMDRIRALNIRAYHFTAEETTHFSILQIAICTLSQRCRGNERRNYTQASFTCDTRNISRNFKSKVYCFGLQSNLRAGHCV